MQAVSLHQQAYPPHVYDTNVSSLCTLWTSKDKPESDEVGEALHKRLTALLWESTQEDALMQACHDACVDSALLASRWHWHTVRQEGCAHLVHLQAAAGCRGAPETALAQLYGAPAAGRAPAQPGTPAAVLLLGRYYHSCHLQSAHATFIEDLMADSEAVLLRGGPAGAGAPAQHGELLLALSPSAGRISVSCGMLVPRKRNFCCSATRCSDVQAHCVSCTMTGL